LFAFTLSLFLCLFILSVFPPLLLWWQRVEWAAGADEGVPRGAVGAVLAYNGRGRVRVAFPRGA